MISFTVAEACRIRIGPRRPNPTPHCAPQVEPRAHPDTAGLTGQISTRLFALAERRALIAIPGSVDQRMRRLAAAA